MTIAVTAGTLNGTLYLVKEKVDKLINSDKISKGKLGNTHGNAFLHHEITFGKNDFNFEKYGIQWQNGKLKFYTQKFIFIFQNNFNFFLLK